MSRRRLVSAAIAKPGEQEEIHRFIAEARRRIEGDQVLCTFRNLAHLFVAFPQRGRFLSLRGELDVGDQPALEVGVTSLDRPGQEEIVDAAAEGTGEQMVSQPVSVN